MSKINLDLSFNPKCFQISEEDKLNARLKDYNQSRKTNTIWRNKNKVKLSQYYCNKRQTNGQYCIYDNQLNILRSIIYSYVANGKFRILKVKNLDFTKKQFILHMESQFNSNMNWQNYGTYWCVDHIIPSNNFNYSSIEDQDFKKCFALSNLRPLSKVENRQKWYR